VIAIEILPAVTVRGSVTEALSALLLEAVTLKVRDC
jgi:hypothetical protein